VKGFSLKSSFLLIFLCLLTELYIFVDPIVGDIFINRAGWTSTEYVTLMGGWVIVFTIIGQLLGGFLGDKFGVREVAMVSWAFVAISNAGLAMIEGVWTNTTLMTIYLCFRAFLLGIAWICVISLCMRLTYSKAGGTQFTAYMSMFNLSGVVTLLLTGKLLQYIDYTSALYLGGALTLITVVLLIFIDPDECDRVLEGRIPEGDQDDEFNGDFGEHSEWLAGEDPKPVSS
jgi:MFS family permease